MVTRLNVFMNGEHIGVFSRSASGAHSFTYAPDWLDNPHSRSAHHLSTAKAVNFNPVEMKQGIEFACDTAQSAIDSVAHHLPQHINENVRDQIFENVLKCVKKFRLTL